LITQPVKHCGGGVYGVGTRVVVKVNVVVSVEKKEVVVSLPVEGMTGKEKVSVSVVMVGVPEALRKDR
jgi:hypothetical protein